ncbi:Hypothetical protein FNO222_0367 [Francisella orientalis]|uniref:Uncharacterized protein n=1 Tax=Francisella orientalis TaxID=299583 RepID=A0ABM5U4P0_9GAMM|nr:hypothetical protein FNO12_0365 [Francisella orientalis FNO12]AKN86669.1 Hypothetical protein FNO24_0365 [Francisella orientalis FNO24]AKN88208.1 Hypothetical protein FNO190_0365 [Francisella orientalis]AKU04962.1 Hypothetical protein FNO01_0365 [Francisella orientalis]QEN19871.1 Hypothetical protein FNO39_0367 [Francisella orientalis]
MKFTVNAVAVALINLSATKSLIDTFTWIWWQCIGLQKASVVIRRFNNL